MIIVKAPVRLSLFGGSTDYEYFYKKYGSFLLGTTINKYVYLSIRKKPSILSKESIIVYSKHEAVKSFNAIKNPLIRETLKYSNIDFPIELSSFSDIPSRTGLGGSSAFCVGMVYLIKKLIGEETSKKEIAKTAIHIERHLLNENGGIQDQIWSAYGGLNSIEVTTDGNFFVKPIPVTEEFKKELENSVVLIYTNSQRNQDSVAKSHENVDKQNILSISKEAYNYFLKEDVKNIGHLLHESWKEKLKISKLISNENVNDIIKSTISMGAYGAKLLGSGGCGFIAVICNSTTKKKITNKFKDCILDFKFENSGVSEIYPNKS